MIALVGVFLAAAASGPVGPVDPWSPGASDAGWAMIEQVQAWPAFRSKPPDWDRVAGHSDPLVRAATAGALGRGRPPGAVALLARLVRDDHAVVRNLALWGLLYIGSPDTKKPILDALADTPILTAYGSFNAGVPAGGFDELLELIGLPPAELARPWPERAAWVAQFDPAGWTMTSIFARAVPVPARVALAVEQSQWDADDGTRLKASFDLREISKAQFLIGETPLGRWGPDLGRRAVRPARPLSLQTINGLSRMEVTPATENQTLLLPGDAGLLPGIYFLRTVPGANPVFFRIRRSRMAERSIPELIAAAPKDRAAALQLGALRARAAAPVLLRRLDEWQTKDVAATRTHDDWTYFSNLIGALASLQTPEAATAVTRQILAHPGSLPSDVEKDLGTFLWAAGEPARPIVEDHVVAWRENMRGSPASLRVALAYPGFAPGSRFARAVEEMASSMQPSGPTGFDTLLRRLALHRLAVLAPDRAVDLIVAALREPGADRLLVQNPQLRPSTFNIDPVLRRVWPIVRDDPAVPAEIKKELAQSIPPAQR
jgi:hypothetical protein